MESEIPLPCSQEPTYPEPNDTHFLQVHFNIILPFMPSYFKWFLSFRSTCATASHI